jgi:hypothetical protein
VKGEADRFILKLCAERSSSHRMTVTLVASDEVLANSPVELEFFYPKSWKGRFHRRYGSEVWAEH